MKPKDFRKELLKIMPGYKWTVHRNPYYLEATGIQTKGFNRMSTLRVVRWELQERFVSGEDKKQYIEYIEYEVKSSGFGLNAHWLSSYKDSTLKRALRGLQNHYKDTAQNYGSHAKDLEIGRITRQIPEGE